MCGRYTLTTSAPEMQKRFNLTKPPPMPPRYNIAPREDVLAIARSKSKNLTQAGYIRWGLVPPQQREMTGSNQFINTRAETLDQKPSFKDAFANTRCVIPATGLFEWTRKGPGRTPMYVTRKDGEPFAFAGIYVNKREKLGIPSTCAIITTTPNALIEEVHDRMPAILAPEDLEHWLDHEADPQLLKQLLGPCPHEDMQAHPVSNLVNDPANKEPGTVEPIPA